MTSVKPSVLVYDVTDQKVLLKTNGEMPRPIASITKLVTAMLVLDDSADLDEAVPPTKFKISELKLLANENNNWLAQQLPEATYTRRELLTATLITSDNNAAKTLAINYSKGYDQFILDMNARAAAVGAVNTKFDEPSGSSINNVSTLADLNLILLAAAKYKLINDISTLPEATVSNIFMENNSKILLNKFGKLIKVCKTGLTVLSEQLKYSISMVVEKNNKTYTISILGSDSPSERTAFAEKLINHVIK